MNSFDLTIFNIIHGSAGKFFLLDWLALFFGSYMAYLLVAWVFILIIKERNWAKRAYLISWVALSSIISRGILTEVIRFFYFRPRPFVALEFNPLIEHETSASFPSGHASFFFALVLPIFYINKKAGWWYLAFVSAMGLGRIYSGVHWPTDIIFGAIFGIIISWIVLKIIPKYKKEESN